jgi:hypothetical protein
LQLQKSIQNYSYYSPDERDETHDKPVIETRAAESY